MKLVTRTSIINRHKKPFKGKSTLIGAEEQYYGFREWWHINERVTLTILFTEREFIDEKESSIFIYTQSHDLTEQVASKITKNLDKIALTARTSGVKFIDLRREDFEEILIEIENIVTNELDYPDKPSKSAA